MAQTICDGLVQKDTWDTHGYIVSDSLATIKMLGNAARLTSRFLLWKQYRDITAKLMERRCTLQLVWCPSHGKPWEHTRPPADLPMPHCRHTNKLADEAATLALNTRRDSSDDWAQWKLEVENAEGWNTLALEVADEFFRRFSSWCRRDTA